MNNKRAISKISKFLYLNALIYFYILILGIWIPFSNFHLIRKRKSQPFSKTRQSWVQGLKSGDLSQGRPGAPVPVFSLSTLHCFPGPRVFV